MKEIHRFGLAALVAAALLGTASDASAQWNRDAFRKRVDAAKAAEGTTLIQYDAQPNYANWGGITNYFHKTYGVRVPPT